MAKKTLDYLRTSALRRADMEGSSFIGRWDANDLINDAGSELHDILVTSYRQYFNEVTTISLVADTETYTLPTDLYKLQSVYRLEGGIRYAVEQFMLDELPDFETEKYSPDVYGQVTRYRIVGNEIYFVPKPSAAESIEIWYVPQYKLLVDPFEDDGTTANTAYVSGDDSVSVAFVNGWERYITTHAAIEMMGREESDTTRLERSLAKIESKITKAAANRDAGKPQRIQDVLRQKGPWGPQSR